VTHGGLCGAGSNPALGKQRAEGGSQGVNVDGPAAVIPLLDLPLPPHLNAPGDPSQHQVAVEDLHQGLGHVEYRGVGREAGRDRFPGLQRFVLQPLQPGGEPVAQVGRQVVPQGDIAPLAVLLVGGAEGSERHLGVQV
jgi:hypothetical protein